MDPAGHQWSIISPILPEDPVRLDGRGRPWSRPATSAQWRVEDVARGYAVAGSLPAGFGNRRTVLAQLPRAKPNTATMQSTSRPWAVRISLNHLMESAMSRQSVGRRSPAAGGAR